VPSVAVEVRIHAPIAMVWSAIKDIGSYPLYMENVRSVKVESDGSDGRVSLWSTLLKGSVLEWREREVIDEDGLTITFNQLDGDLDTFDGTWVVRDQGDHVAVALEVEFEIGIPLLADMLNPVAARALRENSVSMLRDIETRVADA
jgi:uncharacterized membrane protein